MRARQLNMSIEDFLKLNDPPTEQQVVAEEAKKNRVVDHALPVTKPGVRPQGGGVTMSGQFAEEGKMPA